MPRRKKKKKYNRKNACKHLEPMGEVSVSLQPLCHCEERDLVLGTKAYVCQVCSLYDQTSKKISEVYDESKSEAEKKMEEEETELEVPISELEEEEIDLSTAEFEESNEDFPEKFQKVETAKTDLESEVLGELECPFCGELFDNLAEHIPTCEFAPEDADPEDYIPSRKKTIRKKKKKKSSSGKETEKCPHCGKEYVRLARHLPYCDQNPESDNYEG
ncbi:MAG: hypothetical protein ACOC44_06970 [Promethearchaeia archaeon]